MTSVLRRPIGDLVESVRTWDPSRNGGKDAFRYIDLSAIDQETKTIAVARELACSEAPSRARQRVAAHDVLVSTVRPNLNGVAMVPTELHDSTASTGFCVLRAKKNELDPSYLFHWVKTQEFVASMVMQATGASYPAVSDRLVLASSIPLPDTHEQRRIAAILDGADALRAKRREALAQLDSLAQSIFVDMFGDPAENPKGWPLRSLGDVSVKFSDGPFGSNLKSEHYVEKGVRVIRLQNIGTGMFLDEDRAYISERHFESIQKHKCLPGDVLVGTMGDPNLRACILPKSVPVAINKADCVQIRINEALGTAEFLCGLLNHSSTEMLAQGLMRGQTRVRISMGSLRTFELPSPPVGLQKQFADRISKLNVVKEALVGSLELIDDLFSSLQHRAFSGTL